MTQNQLAYLSGLLDADGFIGLDDGLLYERVFCLHTGVTTRRVCRWLQVHFGGEFYQVPRADGTKVYYWKLKGPKAEALAQAMEPLPSNGAAYHAGFIDARDFNVPLSSDTDIKAWLTAVKPYLVERKQQAAEMLQVL